MREATMTDALVSYMPALLRRMVAGRPPLDSEPWMRHLDAVVMFADISGFTPLTERLAARGPAGAEELSRLLNDYFARLGEIVESFGGEVVHIPGDALVCVWECSGRAPDDVLRCARECAQRLVERCHDLEVADGIRLGMRAVVAAGPLAAVCLPGGSGKGTFCVCGSSLRQAGAMLGRARAGQVLATDPAGPPGSIAQRPVAPASPGEGVVDPVWIRRFVPSVVSSRLAAGQADWLAELRRVSVAFMSLDLDVADPLQLSRVQAVTEAVQTVVSRYGGIVKEFGVDDKGTVLIAVWGLPHHGQEDAAPRAVEAVLEARRVLGDLQVSSSAGVATGKAFCGTVQGGGLREYTVIGDVMNLAARIMSAAEGVVWCDEPTSAASDGRLRFAKGPQLRLKGKGGSVDVYVPAGRTQTHGAARRPVFGRQRELEALDKHLEALQGGSSAVVVVEGEAGLGKSHLVEHFVARARARGVRILAGAGDAVERTTPYHAWRPILAQLAGTDVFDVRRIRNALVADARHLAGSDELLPLLNDILPLGIPETPESREVTGAVRAVAAHDLVSRLIQNATNGDPLVLVMEDAQWIDSTSRALLGFASMRIDPVLLVIVTRPLGVTRDLEPLYRFADTSILTLRELDDEAVGRLVCDRLGVGSLPQALSRFIVDRSGGNPLFSEEIAYALRDAGHIEVRDPAIVVAGRLDQASLQVPETLEGVIASRIDRLAPAEQLSVKVASVIGRSFAYRTLRDVHPIAEDRDRLLEYLEELDRLDITLLEEPDPDRAYIFKHVITRDVAYGLLLFEQRRRLHREIAEWYERNHRDDLPSLYPLLVHHWRAAGDVARTVTYLGLAGEWAVRQGADEEGAGALSEALALDDEHLGSQDRIRRARWMRLLGDARCGLGQFDEARRGYEQALRLLGKPGSARGRDVAAAVALVARRRLLPSRDAGVRESGEPAGDPTAEAALTHARLAELAMLDRRLPSALHASVCGIGEAEHSGLDHAAARLYANVSAVAELVGFARPLADASARRGTAAATRSGQRSAAAWVNLTLGTRAAGAGRWREAAERADGAMQVYERIGDRRLWEVGALSRAFVAVHHEGMVEGADALVDDVLRTARRRGDERIVRAALVLRAENALRTGALDVAAQAVREARESTHAGSDASERIHVAGLSALCDWLLGDHRSARRWAVVSGRAMGWAAPTHPSALEGYSATMQVLHGLAVQGAEAPGVPERTVWRGMWALSKVFPVARPRAWYWKGERMAARGRPTQAERLWRRAAGAAAVLEMPWEQLRLAAVVRNEAG